jgi:hypothetical protein
LCLVDAGMILAWTVVTVVVSCEVSSGMAVTRPARHRGSPAAGWHAAARHRAADVAAAAAENPRLSAEHLAGTPFALIGGYQELMLLPDGATEIGPLGSAAPRIARLRIGAGRTVGTSR